MAGVVNNISAFTDYGAEQQDIDRRRKLAELLQQQALSPIEQQTAGGSVVPVSWTQVLAKGLQGGVGGYREKQLKDEQKALGSKMRTEATDWLGTMPQPTEAPMAGSAADSAQFNMAPQMEQKAPTQQQMMAWALRGGMSGNPLAAQMATPFMTQALKANEPYSLREGEKRFFNGVEVANNPKALPLHFADTGGGVQGLDPRTGVPLGPVTPKTMTPAQVEAHDENQGWGEPYNLGGAMVRRNSITGKVEQVVPRPPQMHVYSPPAVTTTQVIDPSNPSQQLTVDARTYKGGSVGSPGVIGISGKLGDAQKLENKRQFNMQGIGQVIKTAEDLLAGAGGRPLPTGSGIGTAVDAAAGLFGISPSGAKEADQIASVGAALVSKMPRMEGPQSDKDVALYKEAAGKIGDSKVPVERRKAALETVKGLWSKYENLNPSAFQGGSPGASGGWTVVK